MRERIGFVRRDTAGSMLLVALVLVIVALPLFVTGELGSRLVRIALGITVISSVALLTQTRWVLWGLLGLVAVQEAVRFYDAPMLSEPTAELIVAFELGIVGVVVLRHLALVEQVTTDTVMSAISGFLLLALIWGSLYTAIEAAWPGSYTYRGQPIAGHEAGQVAFLYYSLVTITTLGYGDILPGSPGAAILAGMEAVVGQLYVAILIARIVALGMRGSDT